MEKPETYTVLVVPALSDIAGQCTIVAKPGDIRSALEQYRVDYRSWRPIGAMNSRGELLWCEPLGDFAQQFKECEPVHAGTTFLVSLHDTSPNAVATRHARAQLMKPSPLDWPPAFRHP